MTVQIALDYRESWEPRGILAESAASIVLSIGVARADSGYDVLGNRAPLFRSELVRDCSTGLPLVLNYLLNQSSDISRDARPAAVLNRLRLFSKLRFLSSAADSQTIGGRSKAALLSADARRRLWCPIRLDVRVPEQGDKSSEGNGGDQQQQPAAFSCSPLQSVLLNCALQTSHQTIETPFGFVDTPAIWPNYYVKNRATVLLLRKNMPDAMMKKRGRPRKFQEGGRPVTVTLPESTLQRLAKIDSDRSRAIVKAARLTAPRDHKFSNLPELVEVAPGVSLITIGPCHCLQEIAWLRLVEVAPARFLLIIPSGTSIDTLELAVIDLLESASVGPEEMPAVKRLRKLIGTLRKASELSKAELLLVRQRRD